MVEWEEKRALDELPTWQDRPVSPDAAGLQTFRKSPVVGAQLSSSVLQRYKAGSERPQPEDLLRIVSVLKMTVADLMDLA